MVNILFLLISLSARLTFKHLHLLLDACLESRRSYQYSVDNTNQTTKKPRFFFKPCNRPFLMLQILVKTCLQLPCIWSCHTSKM